MCISIVRQVLTFRVIIELAGTVCPRTACFVFWFSRSFESDFCRAIHDDTVLKQFPVQKGGFLALESNDCHKALSLKHLVVTEKCFLSAACFVWRSSHHTVHAIMCPQWLLWAATHLLLSRTNSAQKPSGWLLEAYISAFQIEIQSSDICSNFLDINLPFHHTRLAFHSTIVWGAQSDQVLPL